MIKVLIVVYGLVLLVPDGPPDTDPAGLTVLVLNGSAWGLNVPHVPLVNQLGGSSGDLTLGTDFKVVFRTPDVGSIDLTGLAHVVSLDTLTDTVNDGRVKPGCVEPKPGACQLNGQPMVAGRFRLEGTWRTRPLSRCLNWETPLGYRDQAGYEFRPEDDLNTALGSPDRLATAVVFEAEVQSPTDIEVELSTGGGSPQTVPLETSAKGLCKTYIGPSASECVVIEVANPANIGVDPDCIRSSPPQKCRIDRHFSAFYDLVTPPSRRRIPFVATGYFKCDSHGGLGNHPAIRCPPATALPE